MEQLLKIGARSTLGQAKPFAVDQNGVLKAKQLGNMSFFYGVAPEPTSDDFVGSYALFGVEALTQLSTNTTSTQGGFLKAYDAYMGKVAFLYNWANTETTRYVVLQDIFGQTEWTVPLPAAKRWTNVAIIDDKVLVTAQTGDAIIIDISDNTLQTTLVLNADIFKNESGSVFQSLNGLNKPLYDGTHVYIIGLRGIAKFKLDGTDLTYSTWATISSSEFTQGGEPRGAAIIGNNIVVALSSGNDKIQLINKTTLTRVSSSTAGVLTNITLVAVANTAYVYDLNTRRLYPLTIAGSSITLGNQVEFSFSPYFASTEQVGLVGDASGYITMQGANYVLLFDLSSEQVLWSLASTSRTRNVVDDGFGHIGFVLPAAKHSFTLVNKFLQVQGYGVKY